MTKANRSSRHFLILIAAFIVPLSAAHAGTGSFTINNGSTVTSTETLNSGNTGTINAGGTLSEKSGTGIQLSGTTTASGPGNVITVNNSGKILDYNSSAGGAGRAIRDQSGGSNTVINNNSGGLIQGGQNDVIAINIPSGSSAATSPSVMTINNAGTIQSLDSGTSGTTTPSAKGNQAINLTVATGATTVNNESTGVIWATAADAVRPGLNGVVYNDGFIYSNQYDDPSSGYTSSDGIDGQSDSGITIVNGYTTTTVGGTTAKYQSTTALSGYVGATTSVPLTESTIEGGRHGITGGNTGESGGTVQYGGYTGDGVYTMNITNNGGALIEGQDGSGINIDGFGIRNNNGTSYSNELVTVTNYGTITGDGVHGDGDGIDVDGDVTVYNNGTIKSLNAVPEAGSAPRLDRVQRGHHGGRRHDHQRHQRHYRGIGGQRQHPGGRPRHHAGGRRQGHQRQRHSDRKHLRELDHHQQRPDQGRQRIGRCGTRHDGWRLQGDHHQQRDWHH